MTPTRSILVIVAMLLAAPGLLAAPDQPASKPTTGPAHKDQHGPTHDDDKLSVTHGEVTINGQALKYEATAGTMAMKDEAGKPRGNFFFIAYRKEGEVDVAKRPITYVFNGGPGAAAVWLHLGAVGPRTIKVDDEGIPVGPPHTLIDNPNCWLDVTDLVLIDPIGTGYSRPAEGVKGEEFFGVENDLRSVGEFIRLYTTRYERWLSPKFLAGESYGTTRAAGLSDFLLDRYGIDLNGIIFISSVLDFATLQAGGSNDLPYVLYLPGYTAAAAYHKKLDAGLAKDRNKTLVEVQKWAMTDYTAALAKGDTLDSDERGAIVKKLSLYTSLPADFIDKSHLRIDPGAFRKQLLGDQRKIVGRFDARITGVDANPASNRTDFDPSFSYYLPAYASTMNAYARHVLKYESDLPYESLTGRVRPWSMGRDGEGYLDVATSLASAMRENPRMKVMFASGYCDLATPYFATDYTISHMNLSPELRKNVTRKLYEGGHMLYHVRESIEKLKTDVATFVRGATSAPEEK